MPKVTDGTRNAPHGMSSPEGAGAIDPGTTPQADVAADDREPGCFALEEEKGESWAGVGAMRPLIKETRPTL